MAESDELRNALPAEPAGENAPTTKLRVLLMPSAYYPHVGGIEEMTRQLAHALEARGHDVAVLTNRWPGGVKRAEMLDGLSVTRLRFPLPARRPQAAARFLLTAPMAAVSLERHLRSWRPDIVHVNGAGPQSVYLSTLPITRSARIVFTSHGELTFDAHGVFGRSSTLRSGLRRVLRTADVVTACSEFVMQSLVAAGEIGGISRVIPNGVDPDELAGAAPEARLAPYILAVGRLVPQKGFDVLIDAFESGLLDGFDLVLAGEGFERQRLEARAAELGLGGRVHFVGSVDRARLARLLAGALVFALPSRGEAFGIALLEAMTAGVPSVAAAAGGVPEFAQDGKNALLVQPDDVEALGAAIVRLTSDASLRDRLTRGGRATAAELAWSRVAARYEDVYIDALGGKAA
jgi:glycosyltransferase involved in cell wall biosynthesis